MKVVKVKYRGDWRKVIGTRFVKDESDRCYMVLSADARSYSLVPVNDKQISDKEIRDVKKYPSAVRRYKELSQEEKDNVARRFHSGAWTLKEICDMFKITRLTIKKIVGVL